MKIRAHSLALALVVCVSSVAGAQDVAQPDETRPGFKANQVYQSFSNVDSVNLFSGDVGLTVPIGPEYQLSYGLKWQLKAYYSAKLWALEPWNCEPADQTMDMRGYLLGDPYLGAGWRLSLGYVRVGPTLDLPSYSGPMYFSPDGGSHGERPHTQPPPGTCPGTLASPTAICTDDGTHIRIRPGPSGAGYVVDFPDGTQHFFERPYQRDGTNKHLVPDFYREKHLEPVPGTPQWEPTETYWALTKITDKVGRDVLLVTYRGDDPRRIEFIQLRGTNSSGTSAPVWNTISFTWTSTAVSDGALTVAWPTLYSISLPAPGGSNLVASFDVQPAVFPRVGSPGCAAPMIPNSTLSANVLTPLLASITQGGQTYSFEYDIPGSPLWTATGSDYIGVLREVTIPTGGRIQYTYCATAEASLGCPSGGCGSAPPTKGRSPLFPEEDWSRWETFEDSSPGVARREEWDGTRLVSETDYQRVNVRRLDINGRAYDVKRKTFVTDANSVRVHHFSYLSENVGASGLELQRSYFAKPYLCRTTEPQTEAPTPLRTIVNCYQGTNRVTGLDTPPVCGTSLVQGAAEGSGTPSALFLPAADVRRQKTITWYGPPSDEVGADCLGAGPQFPCWQTELTGYDTLAREYATESKAANSTNLLYDPDSALGRSRDTTTHWTPPTGGSVEKWLIKLFDSRTTTDRYSDGGCPADAAPCTVASSFSFWPNSGFLRQTSASEVIPGFPLNSLIRDGRHSLSTGYSVPTVDLFEDSLSGTGLVEQRTPLTTYRIYSLNGLLLNSHHDGVSWSSFQVERDSSTGVITASKDPNGIRTTYAYDSLGRLERIVPPLPEFPTTYCYVDTSSFGPYVLARRGYPDSERCSLTSGSASSGTVEAFLFDRSGRLVREVKALPNAVSGAWLSVRETRYDDGGRTVFQSEWTACPSGNSVTSCFQAATSSGTSFSAFDFLGRPKTIISPDGTTTTKCFNDGSVPNSDFVDITYTSNVDVAGVRKTVQSASRKDILGRTLVVLEPHPATGTACPFSNVDVSYQTNYSYNVLDKLTSVNVGALGRQSRKFNYSRLGFLTSEVHPEKGQTTYSLYDARGNVRTKSEGGNAYTYVYDAASRLKSVASGSTTYVSNTYDGEEGTGGGSFIGKLTRRIGYNPGTTPSESVMELFTYSGLNGRPSSKWTVFSSNGLTFQEGWRYNNLGLVSEYDHPRPLNQAALTERITYAAGAPAAVKVVSPPTIPEPGMDVLKSATYNPAGGLSSYLTANDVATQITQDSNRLPRPRQIRASKGSSTLFDTGLIAYDGAGNITAQGLQTYRYDARGRLTYASYSASDWDSFGYDEFGNMSSYTYRLNGGATGGGNLTVDATKNRIAGANYDLLGNLLSDPTLGGLPPAARQTFTYDALSRLTSATTGSQSPERYLYDGAGERLAKLTSGSAVVCISTFSLPGGLVGVPYSVPGGISATGGSTPYTWAIVSGPPGLTIVNDPANPAKAIIGGAPTAAGNHTTQISVTDSQGITVSTLPVSVSVQGGGGLAFYTLAPCRLVDTRNGLPPPLPPHSGGPPFHTSSAPARAYQATTFCGIPEGAAALAANITVTNSSATGGKPFIKAFETPLEPVAAWATRFEPGRDRATNAVIGLSMGGPNHFTPGHFTLSLGIEPSGTAATDVIVDVSGYFMAPPVPPVPPSVSVNQACSTSTTQVKTYTLRDETNRLRSEFSGTTLVRDNFYLGNLLIATKPATAGWEYYSHDHLGTIRLVTNSAGTTVQAPSYRVFGTELSGNSQKFGLAGMEREPGTGSAFNERYYDHARLVSAWRGRFNSVDPLTGNVEDPQSWNRYAYARGNPLCRVDPDGRADEAVATVDQRLGAAGRSLLRAPILEGHFGFGFKNHVKFLGLGWTFGFGAMKKADIRGNVFQEYSAGLQLHLGGGKSVGPYGEAKVLLLKEGHVPENIVESTWGFQSRDVEGQSDMSLTIGVDSGFFGLEGGLQVDEAVNVVSNLFGAAKDGVKAIVDDLESRMREILASRQRPQQVDRN